MKTDTVSEVIRDRAILSLTGGVLTITLKDLEVNPTSDGQNLTGISFDLTGDTLASSSADLIDVGTGGQLATWAQIRSATGPLLRPSQIS